MGRGQETTWGSDCEMRNVKKINHLYVFFCNQNPYFFINSSMLVVPIDELHDWQIGFRLSTFNSPPSASEIICPQWKFNCVISVRLQHKHFAFPVSSPNHFAHTLRFNDAGIVFFFFLSTTADVTWHRRWHRHRHRIIPMHHN